MNIVQLTPGAGKMYCGNCFRDNALVKALRKMGHDTLMVPLYLPLTLEESDATEDTPIFFNGIKVYLEQKSAAFRRAPRFVHELVGARRFLDWASGRTAKTRPEDVGDLTISMLRGEEGNQARELDELMRFLESQGRPDVVSLSNALLLGLARRIRAGLDVPVVCLLQGELAFIDAMPEPLRGDVWELAAERARDVDLFIAPSHYFGELMQARLKLPAEKVKVIYNGINLEGYSPAPAAPRPPVIGFFARMCRDKGLDLLVEAWLRLKARNQVEDVQLWIGGGCGPGDEPFVAELRDRINGKGWISDVQYHPNLTLENKQQFLRSLTVLSVPALYGEAFGLYLAEAFASGVPVVQPNTAAFPEIVEASRAGITYDPPDDPDALSASLERLLMDKRRIQELRQNARRAAEQQFSLENMARQYLETFEALPRPGTRQPPNREPSPDTTNPFR